MKLISVQTLMAGQTTKDQATPVTPPPMRSIRGKRGSAATKTAVREAHEKLGYKVRSISFTPDGVLVYVVWMPDGPFNSVKSGPRGSTRRRRR